MNIFRGLLLFALLAVTHISNAFACTKYPIMDNPDMSINDAIIENDCVELQAGNNNSVVEYTVERQIRMTGNKTLRGQPGFRDKIIVKAVGDWPEKYHPQCTGCDGVVTIPPVNSKNNVVQGFTVDANYVATLGVVARDVRISDMIIINGICSGVSIPGPGVILEDSIIKNNTVGDPSPCPVAPPGAAIYSQGSGSDSNYGSIIQNNIIKDNGGAALDINSVWGGKFKNNNVSNNRSWAAVSLYGASHWVIEDNVIRHPASNEFQLYHNKCATGPGGKHSAGIFLCQDTDVENRVTISNIILNNAVSSWYGILVIGNDEDKPYLAPRNNIFFGNNVFGSFIGCADDFVEGSWFLDRNMWINTNCDGTSNSNPMYF